LLSLAMLGAAFFPYYEVLFAAFLLAGMSKAAFDPAILSYVAERVPYRRRGTAIGIVEMGWAGSTLAGVPLVGILMARCGWQSPFFAIGIASLIGTVVLFFLLSGNGRAATGGKARGSLLSSWGEVLRSRPAMGVLGFAFFISAANDLFFMVFGAWMEESFHLSLIALGSSVFVVGIAELLGEIAVASLSDRIGLQRGVVLGTALSAAAYGMIPVLGRSAPGALAVLFLIFLFVEFSIVTLISRATELLPEMRGAMMSSYIAASSSGRVAGALLGGPVWLLGRMPWITAGSVFLTLLALGCFLYGFRKQR
ncbi:MAG TPA: MFS transporter, partial [Syntrophales bacterium]|nr:MFS transporter [Syntrophales bacterium]